MTWFFRGIANDRALVNRVEHKCYPRSVGIAPAYEPIGIVKHSVAPGSALTQLLPPNGRPAHPQVPLFLCFLNK